MADFGLVAPVDLPLGTEILVTQKDVEAALRKAAERTVERIGKEIADRVRERVPSGQTRDTIRSYTVSKDTIAIEIGGAGRFLEFGTSVQGAQSYTPPPPGEASGEPYDIPRGIVGKPETRAFRNPKGYVATVRPKMRTTGYKIVNTKKGPRRVPVRERAGGVEVGFEPVKERRRGESGHFLPSEVAVQETHATTQRKKKMLRWVGKDGKVHFAPYVLGHTGMAAKMPMRTSLYEVVDDTALIAEIFDAALRDELSRLPMEVERA